MFYNYNNVNLSKKKYHRIPRLYHWLRIFYKKGTTIFASAYLLVENFHSRVYEISLRQSFVLSPFRSLSLTFSSSSRHRSFERIILRDDDTLWLKPGTSHSFSLPRRLPSQEYCSLSFSPFASCGIHFPARDQGSPGSRAFRAALMTWLIKSAPFCRAFFLVVCTALWKFL